MPFVEDLVLSVSRDSHGQVAVQVTYTPGYYEVEWSYQIYWNWRVLLIRLPEEPPPGQHPIDAIYGTAKFGYPAIDPAFIVATLYIGIIGSTDAIVLRTLFVSAAGSPDVRMTSVLPNDAWRNGRNIMGSGARCVGSFRTLPTTPITVIQGALGSGGPM